MICEHNDAICNDAADAMRHHQIEEQIERNEICFEIIEISAMNMRIIRLKCTPFLSSAPNRHVNRLILNINFINWSRQLF